MFPQLTYYGVELWVPELGGRNDPDSEGHEMLIILFGGLSKASYGYWLVATNQPHPQRQKAAAGIRLRALEPGP